MCLLFHLVSVLHSGQKRWREALTHLDLYLSEKTFEQCGQRIGNFASCLSGRAGKAGGT